MTAHIRKIESSAYRKGYAHSYATTPLELKNMNKAFVDINARIRAKVKVIKLKHARKVK